ncbi:MAG: HAD family phosphatase [Phycisphaerae bacterium]
MRCRAVIFDVDGVLVDSYRAHLEAWQRLASRLGLGMSEEQFASMFGRRNRDIIRHHWGRHVPDDRVEACGDWKEVQYREILQADFPAMDGAAELLDALKAAGFALAVGSSGPPENVRIALEGLGRAHLFDATVCGTEVRIGKPDPEVFLKAAEKLGVEPRFSAVVEDSTAGIEAARRAGMTAIALVGTATRETLQKAGAGLVVESLRKLHPGLIAELIEKCCG